MVSERVVAAVKAMLVAAVPTCLAAGTSSAPVSVGHLVWIAASLIAAGGVAVMAGSDSKKPSVHNFSCRSGRCQQPSRAG